MNGIGITCVIMAGRSWDKLGLVSPTPVMFEVSPGQRGQAQILSPIQTNTFADSNKSISHSSQILSQHTLTQLTAVRQEQLIHS